MLSGTGAPKAPAALGREAGPHTPCGPYTTKILKKRCKTSHGPVATKLNVHEGITSTTPLRLHCGDHLSKPSAALLPLNETPPMGNIKLCSHSTSRGTTTLKMQYSSRRTRFFHSQSAQRLLESSPSGVKSPEKGRKIWKIGKNR